MRRLRHIRALFSQDALGYWRALYVLLLVAWSVSTVWRVASGSLLETPDTSPTLIKIGLLEAVAFLAAWSLLLITLTTKVVNKGRDLELAAHDVRTDIRHHLEAHPDVRSEVERIEAKVSDLVEETAELKREAKRVKEENKELRRQLAVRAREVLGKDT